MCALLIALLIVCWTLARDGVREVLCALLLGFLAAELDRSGGLFAVRIVRLAGRLIPAWAREDCIAEWEDHVLCDGEAGLVPVRTALAIALCAAPRIAFRLRFLPAARWYRFAIFASLMRLLAMTNGQAPPRRLSRLNTALVAFGLFAVPLQALLIAQHRPPLPRPVMPAIGVILLGSMWLPPPIGSPALATGISHVVMITVNALLARNPRFLVRTLAAERER